MIAEEKRREEQIRQQARREELRQINALMNETTLTGEPTEAQMRFAIQSQVDIRNGEIEWIITAWTMGQKRYRDPFHFP